MTELLPTVTVADLIATLSQQPQDAPVRLWLPGSTIAIGSAFWHSRGGFVALEGDLDPGSALEPPILGASA